MRKLVPSLGVSDIQRSTAFYREFFGFEIVDAADDADGNPLWCWLRSGVAELMLQQLTAEQQITLEPALGQSWVLYL
ncbi:MAG: VOC family protein, partial [Burkholderiales bacterium]|nr:VOC family protein [Burkholderiales bacterium]